MVTMRSASIHGNNVTMLLYCHNFNSMKIYIVGAAHEKKISILVVMRKQKSFAFKNYFQNVADSLASPSNFFSSKP